MSIEQELRQMIMDQAEEIDRLKSSAWQSAIVASVGKTRVTLIHDSKPISVIKDKNFKSKPGETVYISSESGAIVSEESGFATGTIASVVRTTSPTELEVSVSGSSKIVLSGNSNAVAGDLVLVDNSSTIVISKIPARENVFSTEPPIVSWSDIGGQSEAKHALIEAVELPLLHPEIFSHYNKKPTKGILLSGPPGCGKTMLGRAVATAVAMGGKGAFFSVKGPEVLDSYVGATEANIRELFASANKHKAKTGVNAVIFIDEADALLGNRATRHGVGGMERTVVPAFLAEMDGLEESGAIVILSTNRPESLDPAIVRDGRMDRRIHVNRPSMDEMREIFGIYLSRVPLDKGLSAEEAAEFANTAFFSKSLLIHEVQTSSNVIPFMLSSLASGAMAAGIVERAISYALHRDIESSEKTGIRMSDIERAIYQSRTENVLLDHTETIMDLAAGQQVLSVRSPAYAAEN